MTHTNLLHSASMALGLLLAGGLVHRIFGNGLLPSRFEDLLLQFNFQPGIQQFAAFAFLLGGLCFAGALLANPHLLRRSNIRRG